MKSLSFVVPECFFRPGFTDDNERAEDFRNVPRLLSAKPFNRLIYSMGEKQKKNEFCRCVPVISIQDRLANAARCQNVSCSFLYEAA